MLLLCSLIFVSNFKRKIGKRACPGVEPGTSRIRSENHTTRPTGLHANSNALPSTNTCVKHLYQLDILFNSNYMYF